VWLYIIRCFTRSNAQTFNYFSKKTHSALRLGAKRKREALQLGGQRVVFAVRGKKGKIYVDPKYFSSTKNV
jgi:hypothetical protein